ncbi:MAG: hypothetical protein ABS96_22135 [Lysobacteraceae bacterium SCN 69-123]|nr:MAG: hypothetical protein ABS96_22135 [Xanthomonadaceae bacterium SCN 69-123]
MSALLALGGPAVAALSISGTVVVEPHPSTLVRGQEATVIYTLTNTGDEPIELATVGFPYRSSGPLSTVLPFRTAATPPCLYRLRALPGPFEAPGALESPAKWSPVPPFLEKTIEFAPLPIEPGGTRRCVAALRVSPETAGPFVQTFNFQASRGAQSVTQTRSVVFGLGVSAIAIPAASTWSLALASLLLLLLGVFRLRR